MGVTHVLPWGKPLTYDDLEAMPEDGHRYELIEGVLIVTPAPKLVHQRAAMRLLRLLDDAAPSDVEVLPGPLDYKVSDLTVLEPDIVVARREDYEERYLRRTPLLVVEVQSPSTVRIDRERSGWPSKASACPRIGSSIPTSRASPCSSSSMVRTRKRPTWPATRPTKPLRPSPCGSCPPTSSADSRQRIGGGVPVLAPTIASPGLGAS